MTKKLHVNCFLVEDPYAEQFRHLVREYNEPSTYEEYQASGFAEVEPAVEILYEESSRGNTGFDLWFATPATGFYFGLAWGKRRQELAQQPAPVLATYPQFLYHPKLRTWLRYNAPDYFCLVSESQLQVRREQPRELFKPEEVEVVTEATFLAEYMRISTLLRERVQHYHAVFQRRGSAGNEWFYCNPIYAGGSSREVALHLRLNVSVNEYGRSWQLLYAHDTARHDARRVASTREEFEQQLQLLLGEAQAATGQEEGQSNG